MLEVMEGSDIRGDLPKKAKAKAKAKPKKGKAGSKKKGLHIKKNFFKKKTVAEKVIENVPGNYTRSMTGTGALLIRQQLQKILELDSCLHPLRPIYDLDGTSRLKLKDPARLLNKHCNYMHLRYPSALGWPVHLVIQVIT